MQDAADSNGDGAQSESFQERMARRYEERNAEARAKLEPLEQGDRPTAVTVGAIASTVLALIFTVSAASRSPAWKPAGVTSSHFRSSSSRASSGR